MNPARHPTWLLSIIVGGAAIGFFGCSQTETSLTAPSSARCAVSAAAAPASFSASGGQGTLTISTERDCTWSVTTDANWVAVGGEHSGQGEATLSYSVGANPAPSARSAALVVGSQRVALNQAAAPCTFSVPPLFGAP